MSSFNPGDNGNPLKGESTVPREFEMYLILAATVFIMFSVTQPVFDLFGKGGYIIAELLIAGPVIIYLARKPAGWKSIIRLNRISGNIAGLSVLLGLSLLVITDEIQRLIEIVFPMPADILESITKNLQIDSFRDFILIGTGVVIVAGITEEILFRGFVQKTLEKRKGVTSAVTTASILFALIHINPWWVIQILILAMFLGIIAWRADSILPGIIIHFINNGIGLWSANSELEAIPFYEWKGHVSPLIVLIAVYTMYKVMKKFYRETAYLHQDGGGNNQDYTEPDSTLSWRA